jgi:hypothetical protein
VALDREEIESWFPVYIRYLGSLLGIVLVVATIFGKAGIDFAGAYVFVTGMILYKTVHDYRKPERGDDNRDRWSHLD